MPANKPSAPAMQRVSSAYINLARTIVDANLTLDEERLALQRAIGILTNVAPNEETASVLQFILYSMPESTPDTPLPVDAVKPEWLYGSK